MGVRAKEIHVCGGLEAENLVRNFASLCGDDYELNTYGRFNKLVVDSAPLNPRGDYSTVRPGDCIVAFNRNDIYAIRKEIEERTPHKCCVVYGNLPPETRAAQAKLFNDPDSGYDILVASDAIGLGLNRGRNRSPFLLPIAFLSPPHPPPPLLLHARRRTSAA
jgi:ATP-dependent RNA helicase SUPV3L1/SUV3